MGDNKLLNEISGLSLCGFLDTSRNMVIVHFFNDDSDKQDIVAYLLKDMRWDVRKIVKEVALLTSDKEIVEIFHESMGVFECDSWFDKLVRKSLFGVRDESDSDLLTNTKRMLEILENNSY